MQLNPLVSIPFSSHPALDRQVLIVGPQTLIGDVLKLMNQTKASCTLIVADAVVKVELLGIFTQPDILDLASSGELERLPEQTIASVMKQPPQIISPAQAKDLSNLPQLFCNRDITLVAVVDKKAGLVGIITPQSLLLALHSGNLSTSIIPSASKQSKTKESSTKGFPIKATINFQTSNCQSPNYSPLLSQEPNKFLEILPKDYQTTLIKEQRQNLVENSNQPNLSIAFLEKSNQRLKQEIYYRKLVLASLQSFVRLIQRINDTSPDIIYVWDILKQRLLYINQKFTKLLGYQPDFIQTYPKKFIQEKLHPLNQSAGVTLLEKILVAQDGEIVEINYQIQDKKGKWRTFSSRNVVFRRNSAGEPEQILGTATEITQTNQITEACQKTEERYRTFVSQISEAIYCFEFEQPIPTNASENQQIELILNNSYLAECNEIMAQMYGFRSSSEMLGLKINQIGFNAQPNPSEQMRSFISSGYRITNLETRETDCTDNPKYYLKNLVGMVENDHLVRLWGTQLDITENRQAQEALKQSEERFRQLTNNVDRIFWIASLNPDQFLYLSPAYETIWGRSCSELYQNPNSWGDTIHPEDKPRTLAAFEQHLKTGKDLSYEFRIIRPDGCLRWLWIRSFVIRNQDGEIYRNCGVAADITERKHMEQALLTTQQELQHLISSSPAVIYSAQVVNNYSTNFVSQNVRELTGYEPTEFTTNPTLWRDKIHPEDINLVWETISKLLQKEQGTCEYRFLCKDGTYQWMRDTMRFLRDAKGNPVEIIGYWANITAQKAAEEENHKALAKEKELSELRSRFITMTSHEFRTPLCTILSSADLLEFYLQQGAVEKQKEHIQRIQNAVLHITNMLNDILMFGQADNGRLEFKPTTINLEAFCRELLEEAATRYNAVFDIEENSTLTGISATQHILKFLCSDIPQAVMDEKLLRQILLNLVSNSLKYSPIGTSIVLEINCIDPAQLKLDNNQNLPDYLVNNPSPQAVFTIKDNGIGIPLEEQSMVFDSFYRGSNLENQPGTGLGLAIVKKAVEIHGGYITLESQPKNGTIFTVILPLIYQENLQK